jgi:peptide methionine sulfoxide reductase msrA/msrB
MVLKTQSLIPEVLKVIRDKGTEYAFSGAYTNLDTAGSYLCKQCGLALFRSQTKFHSGCGWPSFDEEIPNTVRQQLDHDGHRTEIVCERCNAHLGHVFSGEGFTGKNTRHCVNSLSLDFVASLTVLDTEEAILAGGCFWGIDYYFKKLPGILKTEVGYTGGDVVSPTYETVCSGRTGHVEAIRIVYDTSKLTYADVIKYFFEIHDPTQANGQGPDIGNQYLSVIFCYDEMQQTIAQNLKNELISKGHNVVTQLKPVTTFWTAEDYHQYYYEKTGKQPYCHHYIKRF